MLEPGNCRIIETLRDGERSKSALCARRTATASGLMSDESLHRRFFGAKRYFTEKEAAYFIAIDFVDHVALVDGRRFPPGRCWAGVAASSRGRRPSTRY